MMNRNQESAQTAARTRKLMLKPSSQGEGDFGVNVLPIGTHLGEFEIKGLIGEGGFGIVYLAYDHSLERQVALKEYMPSGLATRTTKMAVSVRSQNKMDTFTAGLKSFINEARMLAQFDSPALVKVHSFWEGNGTAYMVMPYYEGVTLKQALQSRLIKPTEGWIRMLLADLCDAIDILHRAHCLHRDIAPDNILLLKDGRPLLLDFGAARRVIGDLTQCFTAILKPGFAPIEQYADIAGLRQGAWTDIYALAAVVYYLITGKAPPPSVARMVHDELVPAREAGKGRYSEAFLATIDKALGVKPEQRFHSIEELRQALGIVEAEPRTVPYPGNDWSTTVARTAPLAAPAEGKGNASPATPPAADADITRHAGPPARPVDDITAIAAPVRRPDSAPAAGARVAPQPGNAAGPDNGARKGAQKGGPAEGGPTNARQGRQDERPAPPSSAPLSGKASRPSSEPQAKPPERVEPELLSVTQMAGDWHHPHNSQNPHTSQVPPHLHEQDTTIPRRRDGKGWLVLALLFAVGIGSGIYLGTNRSWDGLSEQAIDSDSRSTEPMAGGTPQPPSAPSSAQSSAQSAQPLPPASPPAADASDRTASSGTSSSSSAAAGAPGILGAPEQPATAPSQQRSEIDTWKMASKSNQVSGYENYLREYPQGRYAAIAKLRLERLQAAAAPRTASPETSLADTGKPESTATSSRIKPEEAAWSKATAINSAAAYQEYLRKYPRGGYAALARDRLASLKPVAAAPEPSAASQVTPSPATPPSASTPARGNEAGTQQRQARQDARPGARQDDDSVAAAMPPASATMPSAASTSAAPASAAPTSAAPTSVTSAPSASTSTALTPSTSASVSVASASPPQTSTTPASGAKEASSPARAATTEEPARSATQSAGSDGGKSAAAPIPPQASLKPQDATPSAESAAVAAGRIIKFADQTMTGDFSVDKNSGLVSGKGKISWSNGNQFEGTLIQGSKEGKGKFTWNSGQRYSGDWAHDVPNGRGIFNFPDGSRYEGDVKNGLPHGQGTTRFKNGIVYTGDWVRGKSHGHGRYIWTDGSYWEGEFRDDRKTENGRMYFPNKDKGNAVGTAPAPAENAFQRAAAASADSQTEEK